jgi:protein-S-isoprenylcysteine O-methyltransferase Ste14
MTGVLLRLLADTILVAGVLFAAADTVAWEHGWILLAVLLGTRVVSAVLIYPINPALLRDRARLPLHAEQSPEDRLLLFGVLATGFVGLPMIAGLDRFHWHLLERPARLLVDAGLALFVLGWGLKAMALRANAFATTVVRWQRERGQAIVETGPYAVVRHPFYAADPLIVLGLSLWLESYTAALCALVPIALLSIRLTLEERVLRTAFPGYGEYAARVRYRLVPGIW